MAIEIERKFLIDVEAFKKIAPFKSVKITQAYLSTEPSYTVRLRIADNKAYLTIKGKAVGPVKPEFEYRIPIDEAIDIIQITCPPTLAKTRHYVKYKNKTWEVDEFHGRHDGLWLAEIELLDEHESFGKPAWIKKEVTDDHRYANAYLVGNIFFGKTQKS